MPKYSTFYLHKNNFRQEYLLHNIKILNVIIASSRGKFSKMYKFNQKLDFFKPEFCEKKRKKLPKIYLRKKIYETEHLQKRTFFLKEI